MKLHLAVLGALMTVACTADEVVWVDFNAPDQVLVVEVTAEGTDPGPPVDLDLVSDVGSVPVGTATLDPGSGPVGTEHTLLVVVFDEYAELVGRTSVVVSSEAVSDLDGDGDEDSRGEIEYDLRRDPAEPGVFALDLQSQGVLGEERDDEFTVHLWTPDLSAP